MVIKKKERYREVLVPVKAPFRCPWTDPEQLLMSKLLSPEWQSLLLSAENKGNFSHMRFRTREGKGITEIQIATIDIPI